MCNFNVSNVKKIAYNCQVFLRTVCIYGWSAFYNIYNMNKYEISTANSSYRVVVVHSQHNANVKSTEIYLNISYSSFERVCA